MPPVMAALPLIAEIVGIGGGAVGIGEGISAATSGGGGGGAPSTTATAPGGMSPQDMSSIMGSIKKQFPDFQANTGGALGSNSIADLGATGSGNPGDMNLAMRAVQSWLGQGLTGNAQAQAGGGAQPPSPGGGGGAPPGFNIEEFVKGMNKTQPGFTLNSPF